MSCGLFRLRTRACHYPDDPDESPRGAGAAGWRS
jgi:hypothetical protein